VIYGIVGTFLGWLLTRARKGPVVAPVQLLDRRQFAVLSDKAAPHTSTRSADKVYAVVLHQMGFSRGDDPSRYDKVTAHYKILPDGTVVFSHDWTTRLPHGNGFNSGSIGVEFAGNLPSRPGSTDPAHFYKPEKFGQDQLTPQQIASGRSLLTTLSRQGITHVLAHRQSSGSRGNDPGPDVWTNVGQWAVRQLGLKDGGPGYAIGSGRPIPDDWRSGPAQA
jgi:hypothetical protein